jgi:general secretion pathway protein B
MSYILNALRKSEQERQAQETVHLESAILETQPQHNSRISWPVIMLIAVNVLVLIFFIFLNPQKQPATSSTSAKKTSPTSLATPVGSKNPKTIRKTERPQPIAAKIEQPKIKTSPTPNQHVSISKMLKQQRPVKKPLPKPAIENVAVATNPSKPTTSLPMQVETTVTADRPPAQVRKPNTSRKLPFLREMPSTFRRNIPNVNINVFVYAKDPDERFVIINMKKYRTGQKIADELEVAEIKSDSLVLRHNNITFQIKRP